MLSSAAASTPWCPCIMSDTVTRLRSERFVDIRRPLHMWTLTGIADVFHITYFYSTIDLLEFAIVHKPIKV